jgi:hypothetical protein
MFIFHIALGAVLLGLGVVLVVARADIVARHLRLRARSEPAGLWAGLGLLFGLAGALQLVLAFF